LIAAIWTLLAAAALLWPSRFAGPLDGAPLDAAAEAIVIGLLIPSLWWLRRESFATGRLRWLIVALLAWKALTAPLVAQQGLCLSASAGRPLDGINQGIPIVEPHGALRSWDVRADWRDQAPRCTAIGTRPMATQREFPAWFLNVTSQLSGSKDVLLTASGFVTTSVSRTLAVATDSADAAVRVDGQAITGPSVIAPGTHEIQIAMTLAGERWRFEPTLDGDSMWSAALVTATPPGIIDRALAAWAWLVTPILVIAISAGLALQAYSFLRPTPVMAAGIAMAAIVAAVLGLMPQQGLQRLSGLVPFAAVLIPAASRLRNLRGAFLLVGVPWLAFIAALSLAQVGRFTLYSYDDWLTYQVAGHRIYFQGYWLEGGNAVFDFQPLYRWMTGALHLVFGDSSVGELYWDAACVLMGALLAFHLSKSFAGFRMALAAAAATLATMTIGTPWYFLGRGLSEIAAAGWAFLAMFMLLRGRRGSIAWPLAAGVAAALMFYTRLNHLLFAACFPAFLLSTRTPMVLARIRAGLARVRFGAAAAFVMMFLGGVFLFALRTWHYTGVFSLFYGTSLKNNDTGLRPWTLLDGGVWAKIAHSLQATLFMNEPPRPDPRAIVMVAGVLVALLALAQTRIAGRVPAIAVIAAAGGTVGAFLAHAHGYPGRFTIHLLPFASVLAMTGAAALLQRRARWSAA
jgi:hypothetical protein